MGCYSVLTFGLCAGLLVLTHMLDTVQGVCSNAAHTNLKYDVEEEAVPYSPVANIANDLNATMGPPYKKAFFTSNEIEQTFDIDYNSGVIKTKVELDRETEDLYSFYIQKDSSTADVTICITINVTDVNDLAPQFSVTHKTLDIPEGAPHHKVSLVSAIDEDIGANSIAGYRLASGNVDYAFNVTGRYSAADKHKLLLDLGVNGTLDFETTPFYSLTIEVFDGGNPAKTSTMQVEINILDTNDNHPIFNQSKYSAAVYENTTIGTSILEVHATDQDSGDNGKITYSIDRNSDPDRNFAINSQSGVVTLNKMLDFELKQSHKVFAVATDNGNQSISTQAVIEIDVVNINELPANIYITYNNNTPRILENASVGYFVARVSVSDPESADTENNNIALTLHGAEEKFALENTGSGTFTVKVAQALNRETKSSYNLTLIALDSGSPPLSATKSFLLQLDDVNDNAPTFDQTSYEAFVDEMSEPGSYVLSVSATDPDVGDNSRISYSIKSNSGGNSDWFQVDPDSGLVTTRGQVDCEVDSHPSFWLVATDHGSPRLSSSVSVIVSVKDVNDKEPAFDTSLYTASVPENRNVQSCILQVNATDPDCGVNGQIHYSLAGHSQNFNVHEYTGEICIVQQLDHEEYEIYEFSIIATDNGNFSTTANIQITVVDINDNYPEFYPRNYSKNIQDSTQPHSEIITVHATDEDSGAIGRVTYSIVSGNSENKFAIDSDTGTITVEQSLPQGERVYHLVIDARDGGGLGADQRADVYISVTGQGYNPPVFGRPMYRFSISEDVPEDTYVGDVTATYTGSSNGISYIISSGDRNAFFRIETGSGVIRTARKLDHDEFPSFLLSIQADTGSTHLFGTTQVNITVDDVNDNAPLFTSEHVTTSVSEATNTMTTIYSAHATDKDSRANGNGEIRYRLEQSGSFLFTIDATSGDIRLAQGVSLDYETTHQHMLVISAYDQGQGDQGQLSSSMTLTINVQDANDNTPTFDRGHFVTSLSENSAVNLKFEQIKATDKDSGENGRISYSFRDPTASDKFGIFPSDGYMYLKKAVDREEKSEYTFTVVARDHGQPSRSASAQVTIYIEDYNDNSPVFSETQYHFYIEENLPLGTLVGTVAATDKDSGNNALLQYDFSTTQNDFSISSQGVISTTRSLDREILTNHDYSIEVIVQDSGSPMRQTRVRVHITVTDINDHSPEIITSPLQASVEENQSKGVRVAQVLAEDPDAGPNGTIAFSLALLSDPAQQDALDQFAIHPTSGWITTKEVLDYEVKNNYKFKVIATDAGSPSKSTTREFEIIVNDDKRNDEAPQFPSNASIIFYVVENTPIGTLVGQVQAYDKDTGENGRVSYYIIGGNIFGLFSVELETGNIYTIRDIDYEETSSQTVGIKAIDNSVYNPKSSVIMIKINILDTNDNAPIFDHDPVFLKLRENTGVTSVIHTFTATDADSGINGTVMYQIRNQSGDNHLEIDVYTGQLTVARTIDYEQIKDISLIIEARDQAPTPESQLKTHVTVVIVIEDENDNAPVFQTYPTIKVFEDEPVGYQLISIIATDADGNVNGSGNNDIKYSIQTGNVNNAFHIQQNTGVLTVSSPLDREAIDMYTLRLRATDNGKPKLDSEMTLIVQVLDVNDNAPMFLQDVYQANVTENSVIGALVKTVSATDADGEGNNKKLRYMIADGIADNYFAIDPVTGLVTLATSDLDREVKSSYIITLYVQDAGTPILFDMASLIVNVTDVNDNPPVFTESMHFLNIPENLVQDSIYLFVAHDADVGINARVTYNIDSGNIGGKFIIHPDSGVLSLVKPLDHEDISDYTLVISASDGQDLATCEMFISVEDQNDNDPVFDPASYNILLFENVGTGTSVTDISATDKDQGLNGEISYSLHNNSDASLFAIDAISGKITTKGTFDREKKSIYTFDVVATDGGINNRRSRNVRVVVRIGDINDNAPVFQEVPYSKNVSQGTVGDAFILKVIADDKDSGKNGQVTYRLEMDSHSRDYFSIDRDYGDIKTKMTLGPDAAGYHNLKVVATDGGDTPLSTTGVVEINIGTVGSNLQFQSDAYTATIQEHASFGTRVTQVVLRNQPGSQVSYSFASGNQDDAYSIDNTGTIRVRTASAIDYEESTSMRLIVAAMTGNMYAYTTVYVNLTDINDNAPQFSQDRYVTKYYEEQTENSFVMQVTATDADSYGPNSELIYNIKKGDPDNVFKIDPPYSGIIQATVIVDYEVKSTYRLEIEAKDNGRDGSLSSTCIVKISIINTNDNPPKFPHTDPVEISEGTEIGTVVTMVTANDVDNSPPVVYNFSAAGNPDGMFSLDRYSGSIRLARRLDYETRKHYVLGLQASDSEHEVYTTQDVYVLDENDHAPVFSQQSYKVELEESTQTGTPVVSVNATDADAGRNAHISYSLTASLASENFFINPITGTIYTNGSIQYQHNQEIIQLVVIATDNGSQPLSTVAAIYIQVTSVNKHSPRFKETGYSTTINEDVEPGYVAIHHVEAVDLDTQGRNREIDYYIVGGNIQNTFVVDQKNGSIIVNSPLDRESVEEYNLIVMAKDRGIPSKNDTVNVHIVVQDVNDESPYFEFNEYFVTLNESFPNDTGFLTIRTFDNDIGANAKIYHIITSGNEDGIFIVGGSTGELYIMPNANLDYERQTYHKLIIKISDCVGCDPGSPVFMNVTTVHVNVTDVNEFSPEFPSDVYYKGVAENMESGSSVFEAHANDMDSGEFGVVEYSIHGTNMFSIHYKTGLVTNNVRFDYENASILEFQFEIQAKDQGGRKATIPAYLYVVDIDDYAPVFANDTYEFAIPGKAKTGTLIGRVRASDRDQGNAGKVVYRMKPSHNYFGVNASTGEIHVIHDLNKQIAQEVGRRKREINALLIEASSGMDDSQYASVVVDINVDRTCGGCEMQYITERPSTAAGASASVVIIIVVVVAVVAIVLIVIIVFILFRRRNYTKTPPPSETPMYNTDEFDTLPTLQPPSGGKMGNGYHHDVIRYDGNHPANLTTSSDMSGRSGSSGRGSAEDDEDEELAMINSNSPSYLNNSNGFRKNMPDSGIQDDDNASEPSVQNHQDYYARLDIDISKIDSKAKSGLAQSVESMHQFSDSGGGEGNGLEIGAIDYPKVHGANIDHSGLMEKNDMGFHEPEPNMGGSLSNVINSEEEYSGSYNWDYLLDWGPQYQPLAHVFSEIARLKDDSFQPKKQAVKIVPQQRSLNMNSNIQPRMNPPPMITNAPPKVINAQPVSRSNRSSHSSGVSNSNVNSARNSTINTSLPSMPRSPISHESSFTSPALTPSFTPSLSPLATRSPSVSPVNNGRGQLTPRTRAAAGNVQYPFSSSSSEQELRI